MQVSDRLFNRDVLKTTPELPLNYSPYLPVDCALLFLSCYFVPFLLFFLCLVGTKVQMRDQGLEVCLEFLFIFNKNMCCYVPLV